MSYYHTRGHPNCLTVATVQTLQGRNKNSTHGTKLKQNNIHGAELKQNSNHGAELKQRRLEKEMTKNGFYALYLTRKKPDVKR